MVGSSSSRTISLFRLMACSCLALTTARNHSRRCRSNLGFIISEPKRFSSRRCTLEAPRRNKSPFRMSLSSSGEDKIKNTVDEPLIQDPLETLGLPRPMILGSGSFTRKLILKEMGIDFHLLVRSIDEKSLGDRLNDAPADLVLKLAKAKCDHLVSEMLSGRADSDLPKGTSAEGWIVLTGDQVVTHNGDILEKPVDMSQAKDFVKRYANSPPTTVGAVVLTHFPSGTQVSGVDTATIVFRPSIADVNEERKDLIDLLIEDDAPVLSCAGGLMVEHALVQEHLDHIDGTEDSVMGLSKDLVLRLLVELQEKLTTEKTL